MMSSQNYNRQDMSNWLIHFVRSRDESALPYDDELPGDLIHVPFTANLEKNARFDTWDIRDQECPLAPDESAFGVLLRILEEGCIRSSWAFRRRKTGETRPTVYGPRSACCFTEMPLYAFLEYAERRQDKSAVDTYAIAFLRRDLFEAGARPVISGLSSEHKEMPTKGIIPRLLDLCCGIGQNEQYRYVALGIGRGIDWTHEREWRWCDGNDIHECPGLPVWLSDGEKRFSQVLVLVSNNYEKDVVLAKLKEMHDAGCDPYCFEYSREVIRRTRVISLSEISEKGHPNGTLLTLDTIPFHQLQTFSEPTPSPEYIEKVGKALEIARAKARKAAECFRHEAPRNQSGDIMDVCGFASLITRNSESDFVQALLKLNAGMALTGVGYCIDGLTNCCESQALSEEEAAVNAAKIFLEAEFPEIVFHVRTRWD